MASSSSSDSEKRPPVWNVPSTGPSIEVGPVMGAVVWPTLSDSTTKSSSPKPSPDPPVAIPPPLMPSTPPPKLTHQKSIKRAVSNGGATPSVPAEQIAEHKQPHAEPSPRGHVNKSSNWDDGFKGGYNQRRGGNSGYGNNRRGDHQDREWTHHRNNAHAHARMQHPHQRSGGRTYPRPPQAAVSGPFMAPPPPVLGFTDLPLPPTVYYVTPHAPPFIAHPAPHAMFFPAPDPQRAMLLKQIDYYFSNENLCKDTFLREKMDDQGWVPISLIANFNRVKQLTNNIPYIMDTVRYSTVVEVQGEKIRRRNDWMTWLLPSDNFGPASGSQSSVSTADYDTLAARMQTVGMGRSTSDHNSMRGPILAEVVFTRSASGNLNNQYQVAGDLGRDGNGQFSSYIDSDPSKYARSLTRSDTL